MKIVNTDQIKLVDLISSIPEEPLVIFHNGSPILIYIPGEESGYKTWVSSQFETLTSISQLYSQEPNRSLDEMERIDLGMVELSVALAAIAAAIATILPTISSNLNSFLGDFRYYIAIISGFLAIFSSYAALELLSKYCFYQENLSGYQRILKLFRFRYNRNYLVVGIALVILLILSLFSIGFVLFALRQNI